MGKKRKKTIQLGHNTRQMGMFEGCVLGNLRAVRCCLKLRELPSHHGRTVSDGCSRGLVHWRDLGSPGLLDVREHIGCSLMHAQLDWHVPRGRFVLHVIMCVTLQPGLSVSVVLLSVVVVSRAVFLLWLNKSNFWMNRYPNVFPHNQRDQ